MGRFSLDGYTDKCIRMLNDMVNPKYVKADKAIPATLIRHCEGIAFITIFKAGLFVFGGNVGGGCVISKVKDPSSPRGWRWSGPISVTVGGLGGGFIFGGEKIDSLIILNTKGAVRAFMGKGQVTFGGNLSLAAGPVGRDLEAHAGVSANKEIVAAYSYSKAQGLYIGATLEGAFVIGRNEDNQKFYGDSTVTAERILNGEFRPPLKVDTLHRELYAIHDRRGDYASLDSSNPNLAGSPATTSPALSPAPNLVAQDALPLNWRKVFTADGKPYFHNTETNETSWEMPVYQTQQQALKTDAPFQDMPVAQAAAPSYATAAAPENPFKASAPGRVSPPRPTVLKPTHQPQAKALYDFAANRPEELSFKANDYLTVLDKSNPNWWKCSLNGISGVAPSNYLQVIPEK